MKKILLVGVGGVGCEFLISFSELKKKEFTGNIVIIDDDIVEESNLSRQRLYSTEDIGKAKVAVAAAKMTNLALIPLKTKVEDICDPEFFAQFDLFVLAVDNLETRRWMNSTVKQHCKDWILLDMGVQGFKFSIRLVRPETACLECTMSLYSLQDDQLYEDIPVCSIYGQPRDLKDCVYWSLSLSSRTEDFEFIYSKTKERAKEFGIDASNLSFDYIEGLMKRTIPAVASVNSLLAAKSLEILCNCDGRLDDNFWMVNLECGYYEMQANLEVSEDCIFCNVV